MTKDETLKQALSVLKGCLEHPDAQNAIGSIEAALAQPEQELVAWMYTSQWHGDERFITRYQVDLTTYKASRVWPLYTSPPQRKPLHASEIVTMYAECPTSDKDMVDFARAVEAAHGIKGDV